MPKTRDLIEVKDASLLARVIDPDNQDEMEGARTFRHKIFLDELGRSLLDSAGQDIDGFGALSVIFDPTGLTLEEFDRLPADLDLENARDIVVPLERICPVIPSYAASLSGEDDRIARETLVGDRLAPTNSIGVGLASILASAEAISIILRKMAVLSAPQYTYVNLIDRKFLTGSIAG